MSWRLGGPPQNPPTAPYREEKDSLKILCNFEVHLTPPALVERLCNGEPLPPVCREAIFTEELLELAEALGRKHLVTLISCGP
jgi:hypothetical protein